MKTENFKLYWIDMNYIQDLQKKDSRVYNVNPQQGKQSRPHLGILITCNNQKYCVPLTSSKNKHNNMTNKIDFTRIESDGRLISALNFSRMIPVEISVLSRVDLKIRKHDNIKTGERKNYLFRN